MRVGYDLGVGDDEFATAVAASAFAIHSLEEYQRKLREGSEIPLSRMRTRDAETKLDAWEKSEMEKIKKRYEKMQYDILAWENKKKMRAKLQMENKKKDLELRKERNLQHYKTKLAKIDHIAGGARAQMEEKRKYEDTMVKEKARKIRSRGKVPVRCFCF